MGTWLDWATQVNQWLSRHLHTIHLYGSQPSWHHWTRWTNGSPDTWRQHISYGSQPSYRWTGPSRWFSGSSDTCRQHIHIGHKPSYHWTGLSRWTNGSPDTCRQHIHTSHSHHIAGLGHPGDLVALQTPADNTFIQVTSHHIVGLGYPGELVALQTPAANTFIQVTAIVMWLDWATQVSKWILASCQLHRVTSGKSNCHKQFTFQNFSHIYKLFFKTIKSSLLCKHKTKHT